MFTAFIGVSFVRCEQCSFTNNHGVNSTNEYGAAVIIYQFNNFGGRESTSRYEFIDWYVIKTFLDYHVVNVVNSFPYMLVSHAPSHDRTHVK